MIASTRVDRPPPLRDQVHRIVFDAILSGRRGPGTSLTESELTEELGVSRTPLREALLRLEEEGFVQSVANRGFFVAPLSVDEARELYVVLATLERLALRLAGPPAEETFAELEQLNARLAGVGSSAKEAVTVNLQWHDALLRRCPNRYLLDLIEKLRAKVYRYEIAFFTPGHVRLEKSVELHRGIAGALRAGDFHDALSRLESHWLTDLESLLPTGWSAESESPPADE